MALTASGLHGEARKGYQHAATFARWELDGATETLRATPAAITAFWLAQGPLTVHLQLGTKQWVWETAELVAESDDELVFRLAGSPTVR